MMQIGATEETIDSLLKEIDNEMENTINSEPETSDPETSELGKNDSSHEGWKLPLQEIGDETMEMIVSHNTNKNIKVKHDVSGVVAPLNTVNEDAEEATQPLLPSRKVVVFSEGVNFHEYPNLSDTDEAEVDEQQSVEPSTFWKKSAFVPNHSKAEEINDSMIVEAHSEPEEDHAGVEITTDDLLQHTVTDLDKKLSHILDNKHNTQRLKLMTEELDENEKKSTPESPDKQADTLKFTLQPTEPLLPNSSTTIEETSLIHFQSTEDLNDSYDNASDEGDSCEEYMNEVLHSPSKIPLTNTITINNFTLSQRSKETQPRISSGSSCCDSVADLETTIQDDRYNLLQNNTHERDQPVSKIFDDEKPLKREDLLATHSNASRIFSVATSAEGYKSARDTVSSACSMYSEEQTTKTANIKSAGASIEDLDISVGLVKDEDTIHNISHQLSSDDDRSTDNVSIVPNFNKQYQCLPEIPKLPAMASSHSSEQNGKEFGENAHDEDPKMEFISLHDVNVLEGNNDHLECQTKELSKSIESQNTAKKLEPPFGNELMPERLTTSSLAVKIPRDKSLESREDATDMQTNINREEGSENSVITSNVVDVTPNQTEQEGQNSKYETDHPILPPLTSVGSIFLDDPFVDDFETSGESMDLTKSVKPSNYLTIWHMQEEDIKASSPAISSNSQFSRYTNSTNTSASISTRVEHSFKFKPRVISRSKFYYPENRNTYSDHDDDDDHVISYFQTALDPLRRNTIISKKIQENIKSRRRTFAKIGTCEAEEDKTTIATQQEHSDGHLGEDNTFYTQTEDVKIAECETPEEDTKLDEMDDHLELLPCLSDADIGEDFVAYLEALDHDNKSVSYPSENRKEFNNIWDHASELDIQCTEPKNSISMDVIHRLLEEENEKPQPLEKTVETPQEIIMHGVLKTPVKEVSVGRGLSVKGYEAVVSSDIESDHNSVLFKSFTNDVEKLSGSPIRKTHVGSPFKVKFKDKPTATETKGAEGTGVAMHIAQTHEEPEPSILQNQDDSAVLNENSSVFSEKKPIPLPDKGNLYLRLNTVGGLSLHGIKHHRAKFAIEFDNGKNVVQTSWQTLNGENTLEIGKEFEIILEEEEQTPSKLLITLKCRYERPQTEIHEIVEKIPVGKKFPFGKSKFEYQKRYIQRAAKQDEWDFLFARDGSFGRCEISLDEAFLKKVQFRNTPITFNLKNEWARLADKSSGKKLHELPRKPPYAVGVLSFEACYLVRTSPLEKFPKTMNIARDIIAKYRIQQATSREGYLLQEGGDLQGGIQRRFFKLQGNTMLGYHERTRQAKVVINLLKVTQVFGPGDIPTEGERNLTDLVLFSGCFHLVFDNGEKIAFSTESARDEVEWYNSVKRVVDLNRCHQPWVKSLYQNSIIQLQDCAD